MVKTRVGISAARAACLGGFAIDCFEAEAAPEVFGKFVFGDSLIEGWHSGDVMLINKMCLQVIPGLENVTALQTALPHLRLTMLAALVSFPVILTAESLDTERPGAAIWLFVALHVLPAMND